MGGGTAIGAAAGIAAAAAALLFSQWQRTGRRSRAARQLNHKLQEGYVLTLEELGAYDGLDPNKPTLLAIRGQVTAPCPCRNPLVLTCAAETCHRRPADIRRLLQAGHVRP